jgi:hypothetical protein
MGGKINGSRTDVRAAGQKRGIVVNAWSPGREMSGVPLSRGRPID